MELSCKSYNCAAREKTLKYAGGMLETYAGMKAGSEMLSNKHSVLNCENTYRYISVSSKGISYHKIYYKGVLS